MNMQQKVIEIFDSQHRLVIKAPLSKIGPLKWTWTPLKFSAYQLLVWRKRVGYGTIDTATWISRAWINSTVSRWWVDCHKFSNQPKSV